MEIKIGKIVMLNANKSACNRTKNRIREHGSQGFEIMKFVPGSALFDNSPAILFESLGRTSADGFGGKERWRGWLPIGEIIMLEGDENAQYA